LPIMIDAAKPVTIGTLPMEPESTRAPIPARQTDIKD
jgi:hypothetical protein